MEHRRGADPLALEDLLPVVTFEAHNGAAKIFDDPAVCRACWRRRDETQPHSHQSSQQVSSLRGQSMRSRLSARRKLTNCFTIANQLIAMAT